MFNKVKRFSKDVFTHRYGFTLFAFLTAAGVTGIACVLFIMLLPIMLASILAFIVARLLCAQYLYRALSENYNYLLDLEKPQKVT